MSAVRLDEKHHEPVESLDARIQRTEQRIAKRRLVIVARTSDVTGQVRGNLGSPLLMLGAAGFGFVFAQFRRRRSRDEHKRDSERPEVVMKPSLFASITDALTLATTLLAMMPLIRSKAKEGVQEATGEIPPT